MTEEDREYYNTKDKLLETINRLPTGKDKIQFHKLSSALSQIYTRYSIALVEARSRPSPGNSERAKRHLEEYLRIKREIEISLTLATLLL